MLVEDGAPLLVGGVNVSAECFACESEAMARARWPLPPVILLALPCSVPSKVRSARGKVCLNAGMAAATAIWASAVCTEVRCWIIAWMDGRGHKPGSLQDCGEVSA